MNFQDAQNAITSRFNTEVASPNNYAVQYDNDGGFEKPNNEDWIRLTVQFDTTRQVETGESRRWRTVGRMTAQIFVLADKGESAGAIIADKIVTAFRGIGDGELQYQNVTLIDVGRENRYWQMNCITDFYFDDCD